MVHINIEDVAQHEGRFRSRKLIIPVFVPHLGCPHDCCFCNQRKISGETEAPTYDSVVAKIKEYKDIALNYGSVEIAFYGGSFTAIPWCQQEMLLKAAKEGCKFLGFEPEFRASTRPDCIDDEVLDRLSMYGVKTIELGVQSMDDEVLKLSGRGHLAEDTVKAAELIKKHGIVLGIQTMPGLPGSSYETEIFTAKKVIELMPSMVRIYPTIVIKGTELEQMYLTGEYKPLELDAAVRICAELTGLYEASGVKVIRTGLQSSDNISTDGEVAAGPYHPAFGEMVKSRMALEFMQKGLTEAFGKGFWEDSFSNEKVRITIDDGKALIVVPMHKLSQFMGQKKCNIKELQKSSFLQSVRIIGE